MALAVASLAATPALAVETDVGLGGVFAYSVSQHDGDSTGKDTDAENNGSFLRVDASASDTDRGIKAFVVYERGFDRFNSASANNEQDDFVREFYAGVSGRYGTLSYGRMSTFYKQAGQKIDPFYDTSIAGFNGQFSNEGAGYGLSNLTNAFTSNTVAYQAPTLVPGLTLRGSVYLNDNGEAQAVGGANDDDDFGVGAAYENADLGFAVGVEYLDINSVVTPTAGATANTIFGVNKPVTSEAVRVYGGYKIEKLSLGASFEQIDVEDEADPRQYMMLSATYALLPDIRVAATYGLLKDVVPNAAANPNGIDGDGFAVGAFYDIIENLTGYVAARSVSLDAGDDISTVAAGLSYAFGTDLN